MNTIDGLRKVNAFRHVKMAEGKDLYASVGPRTPLPNRYSGDTTALRALNKLEDIQRTDAMLAKEAEEAAAKAAAEKEKEKEKEEE